jgi:SAM-dependent methyltransferase
MQMPVLVPVADTFRPTFPLPVELPRPASAKAEPGAADSPLLRWYPEARLGGFTDIDGTVAFYSRVRSLLSSEATVVDVGCGRGVHGNDRVPFRRELRTLRGHASRVIGIDVDGAAACNPLVDEFRLIPPHGSFPIDDEACDLIVGDFVLEHVPHPGAFLAECNRILRPGGRIALRTTNALSYVGLISRLIPNRRHAGIVSRVQNERQAEDVFPTAYKCNTARRLRRALGGAGFDSVVYGYESEPRYFQFSRALYGLAVLHQRFAPRAFRLSLFAFGEKRAV